MIRLVAQNIIAPFSAQLDVMRDGNTARRELEQLLASLEYLSDADRGAICRIVQQVARIESEHGEEVALAVTEQMGNELADRVAA